MANTLEPPSWLPAEGNWEWKRVLEATKRYPHWLQQADRAVRTAYCATWALFVDAAQQVARHGALVPGRFSAYAARGEDGALVKNPAAQLMRDATAQLRALAIQLGFTPDVRVGSTPALPPPEWGVRDPARLLTQ